jgi:ubiquinone/menaquinone biosynthesis C-methylase UbiE
VEKSPHYLMENQNEWQRLEQKTDARESWRELRLTGLAEGMTALDAGGGTGAVGRVMAQVVGGNGHVTVLDQSAERLAHGERLAGAEKLTNISFTRRDLELPPAQEQAFDYIWSRFVFEYLPRPDLVLANLVRATRVGGRVVVGDLDGNGLQHYPMTHELEVGLPKLMRALAGQFDPHAGRKLYSRFRRAGLEDIQVHLIPYHVYAGTIPDDALPNWRQKLEVVRPAAVAEFGGHAAGEAAYDRFAQAFIDHLKDPDSFTYSTLILVSGKRVR